MRRTVEYHAGARAAFEKLGVDSLAMPRPPRTPRPPRPEMPDLDARIEKHRKEFEKRRILEEKKRHVITEKAAGAFARGLAGATLGGVGGYYMSPEDRKGLGTVLGIGMGGTGAVLGGSFGHKLMPQLGENPTLREVLDQGRHVDRARRMGALMGGATGVGASQLFIDKKEPDSSEDPYRYSIPR